MPGLLLFYGGTFDPIHNGHLAIARAAADVLGCVVRLMPAADPPHRPPPGADAHHRAEMVALAVRDDPRLCIDRRELERIGRSYSVDTLRQLRDELGPHVPLALLVGADSLASLPTWKDWRRLPELAHFVVADRPESDLAGAAPELGRLLAGRWTEAPTELLEAPAGRVLRLRQPLHPESATAIRQRIAEGGSWRRWVPAPVADHIEACGLYGAASREPGRGPL